MARFMVALISIITILNVNGAETTELRTLARGAFSSIHQPTQVLVTNATQWNELWQRHQVDRTPPESVPKIDFEKESVIFVTLGRKRTGGYAVEIAKVQDTGKVTEVLVRTRAPKPGGFQLQALSVPFHIVAVPKIAGPVEFRIEPERGETR